MQSINGTQSNGIIESSLAVLESIEFVNLQSFSKIEELERRLTELPANSNQDALSMRLALFTLLVDLYTKEACFEAALLAMRRAEFILLELIEDSERWVDPREVSFFIERYCKLELFGEAERMAEEAMMILRQRDDWERSDERYYLDAWMSDISHAQYRHEKRREAMKNSPDLPIQNAKVERYGVKKALANYFELTKK